MIELYSDKLGFDSFIDKRERNSVIEIEVYSDEILKVRNAVDKSEWTYLGALFVPVEFKKECIIALNNGRCIANHDWHANQSECTHDCGYHEKNNTEIHYADMHRSSARLEIAKNWINFIFNDSCKMHPKFVYLNILGLNLTNMSLKSFGDHSDHDLTIYNRFYRTNLIGGINYFFSDYRSVNFSFFPIINTFP